MTPWKLKLQDKKEFRKEKKSWQQSSVLNVKCSVPSVGFFFFIKLILTAAISFLDRSDVIKIRNRYATH
jgi:hypothetical protein